MFMKKLFGALVALVAFGALGAFVVTQAQNIGYNQGYQPDQPIPFSHAKHAGDLKIDCKYCHFGADKGNTKSCGFWRKYTMDESKSFS
jgi:hypothetical protein